MELRIRGNDIELDGIKVARLFDIRTYQRQELESLFDKANNYQDDVDKAFNKGKEDDWKSNRMHGKSFRNFQRKK